MIVIICEKMSQNEREGCPEGVFWVFLCYFITGYFWGILCYFYYNCPRRLC